MLHEQPIRSPTLSSTLRERTARMEVTCERIPDELRELRCEMREVRRASSDFRILFSAIIAVALCLAGVMANGFGWI